MKTLNILLVEDNDNHAADCVSMLAEIQDRLPVQVTLTRATTLEDALPLVAEADGVLTDVFYPAKAGDSAETPSGQQMVAHCLRIGKPVVWCTSTYHHGTRTNTVSQWGREHGLEMFDTCAENGEAPYKPWDQALAAIVLFVRGVESGEYIVRASGVQRREGGDGRHLNGDAERLIGEGPSTLKSRAFRMERLLETLKPLIEAAVEIGALDPRQIDDLEVVCQVLNSEDPDIKAKLKEAINRIAGRDWKMQMNLEMAPENLQRALHPPMMMDVFDPDVPHE